MKAYENKVVGDSELMRRSVEVAMINIERSKKKGKKRPLTVWNKTQAPVDRDIADVHMNIVKDLEKKTGNKWLELIYKANGIKPPIGRGQANGN